MLTLNDNFKSAIQRANVEPRFIVKFGLDSGDVKVLDGLSDQISPATAPSVINSLSPVATEIDPLTRKIQVGSVTMIVEDSFMRRLIVNERLKGKLCTIKFGAKELVEADYINYFTGTIEDIAPEEGSTVRIEIEDVFATIAKHDLSAFFLHIHPLEAIKRILQKIDVAGILLDLTSLDPLQAQYDKISHFVIHRARVVSMGVDSTIVDENSADLIDELSELLNGQLIATEDGKLTFKISDPTAAVVATWSEDQIDEFSQTGLVQNLINKFIVEFGGIHAPFFTSEYIKEDLASQIDHAIVGEPDRVVTKTLKTKWLTSFSILTDNITDVQTSFFIQGPLSSWSGMQEQCFAAGAPTNFQISAARPLIIKVDDEFMTATGFTVASTFNCSKQLVFDPDTGTSSYLPPALSGATGSLLAIPGSDLIDGETFSLKDSLSITLNFEFDDDASVTFGFIGVTFTGADSATTVADTMRTAINAQSFDITASGTGPLVIVTQDINGGNFPIIDTVINLQFVVEGFLGGVTVVNNFPNKAELTGVTRGAFGTTAVAHNGFGLTGGSGVANIIDYTFPKHIGDRIIERFKNGLNMIEVTTSFAEFGVQVGDLVKIVWPEFVAFGIDGLDAATTEKWEVIGKEADIESQPPKIKWTLASSTVATTPTNPTGLNNLIPPAVITQAQNESQQGQETSVTAILDGFVVTSTGGLNINVSPGTISNGLQRFSTKSAIAFAVPASMDIYVIADVQAGEVSLFPVALGATVPIITNVQVLLAKVTTDGSSVTTIGGVRIETTSTGDGKATSTQQDKDGSIASNSSFSLFSKG